MTEQAQKHPADSLALALQRSSGLLMSVGELFESDRERFAGGEAFVAHAISTVAEMLVEARNALADLHYACDLTLLEPTQSDQVETQIEVAEDVANDDDVTEPEHVYVPEIEKAAVNMQAPAANSDEFAQSYLDLLNKLTAAEVFAAEQQALSAPGTRPDLLPLLKSLREDLQKIHNVA